ncbi:MAG: arginine--tRNA ligase, partial [Flavobacteriaceae bacterium]|nr:arginine--tRNA ligase [Flavobacteriaceae bacterium]
VDFDINANADLSSYSLHQKERDLIAILEDYPSVLEAAASQYSPALIANYTYDLVKTFNSFYQNVSILGESNQQVKSFRVQLSKKVAAYIKESFALLGIEVPDRM